MCREGREDQRILRVLSPKEFGFLGEVWHFFTKEAMWSLEAEGIPLPGRLWVRCGAHLVTAANVAVRQRAGHELIEHNPVGIDIRLEAVGVRVLHTDHLSRLQ